MKVIKRSRSGGEQAATIDVRAGTTMEEVRTKIAAAFKISPVRQGLSVLRPGTPSDARLPAVKGLPKETLGGAAADKLDIDVDKDILVVKDLGAQIGYRTVFVVEYLGPILILLAYMTRPAFLYGEGAAAKGWNPIALLACGAWVAHFVKRELETFFVHEFTNPTMPLFNLFKNSMYYWGFALAVGYPLAHPDYTAPASANQIWLGGALMAVAELINFAVHVQLRMMPKGKARKAPGGPLFALVSCPNYTAEVLSWVGFSIMTQVGFSYAFTLVGFAQMAQWALGKHRNYIKADPEYKRLGRKAIVPFLL